MGDSEAAQWKGSFEGMVAVEKELRARLNQLEEGVRQEVERLQTKAGTLRGSAERLGGSNTAATQLEIARRYDLICDRLSDLLGEEK